MTSKDHPDRAYVFKMDSDQGPVVLEDSLCRS